ncbi:fucose permease [Bacillus mesophilus]|uniref:MFS transporter n=1 Tax=Bacillus mesophilus TaxID=1808955 RepID=A0A6M0Q5J2_9BACI|nr:MFS transporter [Bacillus mesophilus]MBM7660360.1 fucose permease [Bacillus mesophilus]NEY71069.1 MFS transporter [Bacillus mesophilus]
MTLLLLLIIYLAFISLGLPDSLLGAAWPLMQKDFGVPLETAGILFMTIAGGTIVSSIVSGKVIKRFGTGKVTFFSGLLTASALLGMYVAPSIIWMGVWSILLGFGAGAVDTALNNYVANHYKAHHMSWLHSFWGVGATLGPVIIMAGFMLGDGAWRNGYLTIAIIQFILAAILLISLPLWNNASNNREGGLSENTETLDDEPSREHTKPLHIKGVKLSLLTFLFYCGVETTVGLWGSSYLVNVKELSAATAAQWVSFYWGGLTIGRFLTGFVTFKMSNTMLIRLGQIIALVGAALLILPLPTTVSLVGFIMVGFGFAPIYPSMLHETPARFGKTHSQTIMGYQMAVAYTGGTFIPPTLGLIASHTTIGIFPFFIVIFIIGMLLSSERLIALLRKRASVFN